MESESLKPSVDDAARILQSHADAQTRSAQHTPSRSFVLFQLWGAITISLYVAVFLLSFGGQPLDETGGVGTFATSLLVFPILTYSLLVSGTRERFGVRARTSPGHWIAYAIILLGFFSLMAMTIVGYAYPWWLNFLVPILLLIAMVSGPIRLLQRAQALESERWRSTPLEQPVRWVTIGIGIALGGTAACSTQPWFALVQIVVAVLIIVCVAGSRASWGLPRVGFAWGPMHWATFGASVGILFILTALLARTDWVTTPWAIGAGIVIAVGMSLAALFPFHKR